jgi:hypothetical protein
VNVQCSVFTRGRDKFEDREYFRRNGADRNEAPDTRFAGRTRNTNRALWGEIKGGLLEISSEGQIAESAVAVNRNSYRVRSVVRRDGLECQRPHLCVGHGI